MNTPTTPTTPTKPVRRSEAFVARIRATLTDPGQRAALRRGLGRTPDHPSLLRAHGIVAPFLPAHPDPATERAYYTIAALMAAQPRQARDQDTTPPDDPPDNPSDSPSDGPGRSGRDRSSLGRTLANAVHAGTLNPATTEARLHMICRQDLDGAHRHLPRLITRLRAEQVPIDWATLLDDLASWQTRRDQTTKRWLQDYHRTHAPTSADPANASPHTQEQP